jgi:hypothetical protein
MRLLIAIIMGMGAGIVALTAATESAPFSRYQIIIDQSPFGGNAGGPAGDAPSPLRDQYLLVGVVNEEGQPLQAVIQDRANVHRIHFRSEGETINNEVKVVKIEANPAKIVLQKGLDTASLSLQPRTTAASPTPVAAPGAPGAPTMSGAAAPGAPGEPRRIPFRRGN